MRKFFTKIIVLWIILCLNYTGILAIGETSAYFNDSESSSANTLTVGSLDFSLSATNGFSPPSPGGENKLEKTVDIINNGSLNFQYSIDIVNIQGELCDDLSIEANNTDTADVDCSAPNLNSFLCENNIINDNSDSWIFTLTKPSSATSETCEFNLIFNAWQTNLSKGQGFSDQEIVENEIIDPASPTGSQVVLNEFLPNPNEFPDEYIELYNLDSQARDINGYYIQTSDGTTIPINTTTTAQYAGGSTVIEANSTTTGWMAITTLTNDDLDNTADTLTLYNDNGNILDSVSYPLDGDTTSSVPQDKSIARIPDGTGSWVDPWPTPGGPNLLSEVTSESIKETSQPKNPEVPQDEEKTETQETPEDLSGATNNNSDTALNNQEEIDNSSTTVKDVIDEDTATSTATTTNEFMKNDEQATSTPSKTTVIDQATTTPVIDDSATTTQKVAHRATTTDEGEDLNSRDNSLKDSSTTPETTTTETQDSEKGSNNTQEQDNNTDESSEESIIQKEDVDQQKQEKNTSEQQPEDISEQEQESEKEDVDSTVKEPEAIAEPEPKSIIEEPASLPEETTGVAEEENSDEALN